MHRHQFHYTLPEGLIARHPLPERSASRMLCLPATGDVAHRHVRDLPDILKAGDVLVVNDTAVIRARLRGIKDSGGGIEILVERIVDTHEALCQTRSSKPLQADRMVTFADGSGARMQAREGGFFRLRFDRPVLELLDACGEIPLPPYLERPPESADEHRYQTVFAASPGAVAAPTAGLHFDPALLAALEARGVNILRVTLHVGAGTFQPVRVDDIATHRMHAEWYSVGEPVAAALNAARADGRRIIAVGTTVVRTLESIATEDGRLQAGSGDTRLFITPGYDFRCVDALLTNFHLPETTLLMLVCAFAGQRRVLDAYAEAVRERYRFFSYGDAMFLEKSVGSADV